MSGNRFQCGILSQLEREPMSPGILRRREQPELAVGVSHNPALRCAIDIQGRDFATDHMVCRARA